MTGTLIEALRGENAARREGDAWAFVPRVPTLAMMTAAAGATDVLVPGDRAGDWIELPGDAEKVLLEPGLVSAVGEARALELCVAADAWTACIGGLEEWIRTRGQMGGNEFSEGWLRPFPDRCPPDGWAAHSATKGEAFSHRVWPKGCDEHSGDFLVAPVRAASIMVLRASQATLGALPWCEMEEAVDPRRMPAVPGRTREHRFDDEERPWIVMAALWRGAVAHLLSDAADDGSPVPEHPDVAGFRLCELLSRHVPSSARGGQSMFEDVPWRSARIRSSSGSLEMSVGGGLLSWDWSETGGRGAAARRVRLEEEPREGLLRAIRRVCAGSSVELERET